MLINDSSTELVMGFKKMQPNVNKSEIKEILGNSNPFGDDSFLTSTEVKPFGKKKIGF